MITIKAHPQRIRVQGVITTAQGKTLHVVRRAYRQEPIPSSEQPSLPKAA